MSLAANQRRPFDRRDRPVYGEQGHGPQCYGLPTPKQPLTPPVNFKNGTELDSTSGGNPR
jgi:phospholipid/cholesterol/gamma-HCH transport system substrate-binding protein